MRSVLVVLAAMLALAGCGELNLDTSTTDNDAVEIDTGSSGQVDATIETDASEPQTGDDATETDTSVTDNDASDDDATIETDVEEFDVSAQPVPCVNNDGDGVCVQNADGKVLDCDDSDSNTYLGAEELCDSVDNNCNGQVDEGVETWMLFDDHDGDGFGADKKTETCSKVGYVNKAGDCNDSDPEIYPGANDPAGDGIDQNCDDGVTVEQGSSDFDAGSTETDEDVGSNEDTGNEVDESDAGSTEADSGDTDDSDVINANDEFDTGSTEPGTDEDAGNEMAELPIALLTANFVEQHEFLLTYQIADTQGELCNGWDNEDEPVEDAGYSVSVEMELNEDVAFVRVNVTIDEEVWLCSGNGGTAALYQGSVTTIDLPAGYQQGMAPFIWDDPSGNGCSLVFEVWQTDNN